MSRNRKNSDPQDTSRSPPSQDISATTLGSAFFVPTHPLLLIVICYGLYLTLCSAACPLSCLPSYLPLASLASHLGTHHPLVMSILAGVALGLHLLEALYTFHLTKIRLNMRPTVVFLWTLNVLLAGIFCLWVLLFPGAFISISGVYCRIPASFCYNLPK